MLRLIVLPVLFFTASNARPTEPASPLTRIDHVIVGVANLEEGIVHMQRLTGVRAVIGGVHPGRGTRNALMSLGDGTYLELLAPDPAQGPKSEMSRELSGLKAPSPVGWAVSGPSERGIRSALKNISLSASAPGSRRKPDGSLLEWVTFGYAAVTDPLAPFFIIWSDPALHPSRTSPGGCRLVRIALYEPTADTLRSAIAPLALPVTVTQAPTPRMRIELKCRRGKVKIGS